MDNRLAIVTSVLAAVLLSGCGAPGSAPEPLPVDPHHQHSSAEELVKTQATWNTTPAKLAVNKDAKLSMQIKDHHNKPIEEFEISHQKKMHLIIVSRDLAHFQHIHPEYKGEGRFDVTTQFPAGGEYKVFADFVLPGGAAKTESKWLKVEGTPSDQKIKVDRLLTKTVEGKEVTLKFDKPLQPGVDLMMTFTTRDATSKQPITDLEPYLGATGHVVALSADAETYLHVHPIDEKSTGPDALFHIQFPSSGLYKLWGQFQHRGETFIVPFVVEIP